MVMYMKPNAHKYSVFPSQKCREISVTQNYKKLASSSLPYPDNIVMWLKDFESDFGTVRFNIFYLGTELRSTRG